MLDIARENAKNALVDDIIIFEKKNFLEYLDSDLE
jgi:23S rRNA G2445 N2-methylase RlmL